jgi:hypothetical protein
MEGWTVFTLQINGDSRLRMSIFSPSGRLMGTADSEGCGILLHSTHPMEVRVVIENATESDVDYVLHIL